MSIAGSVLSILDWLKSKLPIPDRLEAIKNQIDKLEREKCEILISKADTKKSRRLVWINARLVDLNERMQNASNSS
jgi:hypothetical protein